MRILLATDHPDLEHALTLYLSERSIHVVDVVGDPDSLRQQTLSDQPDAVLVDWRLGEAVGVSMVSCLLEGDCPTPVVVLGTPQDHERARRTGATAFATLGDHPDALLATLLELGPEGPATAG